MHYHAGTVSILFYLLIISSIHAAQSDIPTEPPKIPFKVPTPYSDEPWEFHPDADNWPRWLPEPRDALGIEAKAPFDPSTEKVRTSPSLSTHQ